MFAMSLSKSAHSATMPPETSPSTQMTVNTVFRTDCYVKQSPPPEHLDQWMRKMGTYCTVYFDDVDVCSAKSAVPDELCVLFQESYRLVRTSRSAEDDVPEVVYVTTRDAVLARLDLLGCTSQLAREQLSKWIKEETATWEGYASGRNSDWAEDTADAIGKFTIEDWYARVPQVLATRYTREQHIDAIDRHMKYEKRCQ